MSSSPTPPSPPSPPSPPPPSSHFRNLGTMVPGADFVNAWQQKARKQALDPSLAYAMAVAADRLRERQAEVGYRLYWLSDRVLGGHDVVARPSGYVVIGRHGSCDVVLDDERVVSLRHVLVRAASLDDGFPVLSVLDLQSTTGFELSDGWKQRSIAATGPVVFRVGTHSVVALPSSGRYPEELPQPVVERAELAPHRVVAVRLPESPAPAPASASLASLPSDGAPLSRITLLPHSVDLSQRRSAVPMAARSEDYVPTGEGFEVTLASRGRRAGVRLSHADLEHGVLIGRAEKCVDEGLRSVLVESISRVHVLLIREQGACHLYDVASLVGTYEHGRRVRCVALEDGGTTVQLASHSGVTLIWRAL